MRILLAEDDASQAESIKEAFPNVEFALQQLCRLYLQALYREIICRKFHRTLINQFPFEIRQYCILYDAA